MTLNELMSHLALANVKLGLSDGQLSVNAPKGAVTDEIKQQLQRYKAEIIALLSPNNTDAALETDIPVDPDNRYEPFPFSDLQVGFYMANDPYMEYHVRPHYYCETDVESLDIARYELALNRTIERHRGEIVLVCDDRNLQALREIAPVKCKVNDLRHLDSVSASGELLGLREKLKRQELPLDRWPWFDLQISLWIDNGRDMARIHFNHNNFYSDGYGGMILQREIDRYYAAPDLIAPPLQLTFRDSILGLQTLSQSRAGQRAQKYWLERLADLPEPPNLPRLTGVDKRCRSTLQRRENSLSAQEWDRFKEHASQHGLTPSAAVITAYAEILAVWSGSRHFILSNMVTRRLPIHREIGDMIGNFASLYPLEVDLRAEVPFCQQAQKMQQQILRDSNNREWGGMQVMQAFNRLKGEFGSAPCPFVVGSGLFLDKFKKADFSCLETAQTVLDHQFWEPEDGSYYYVWDLLEQFFPQGMIDQMWRAFGALLQSLADHRDTWSNARLQVTGTTQPQGDSIRASSVSPQPPMGMLHEGLARAMAQTPDKIALRTPSDGLSYRDLDLHSTRLAAQLQSLSVEPDRLVALVMDRGALLLAAALGILKSGAAYVPIDPSLPAERMHYMLANSKATVVLTDQRYLESLTWPDGVKPIAVDIEEEELQEPHASDPRCSALPTNLAYVIYTSGSTGNPKGVMIDHHAALNTIVDINERFQIGAQDVVFGVSSFSFDLSVYDVFGVLHAGATLVYPAPSAALNPAHWLDLLEKHAVTVWNSAPPLMSLLLDTAVRQGVTLPGLRLVMLSGDWIPIDMPGKIRALAPNATIVSLGGATEAAIWSIYYVIEAVNPAWSSIPYGRALANQDWQVRDAFGRACPTWVAGDLFISGSGLARGYWDDAEKTRSSFVHDPTTGQRLYRTGDRGRMLPDGNIEFLGRADSQVKIQGHRIELGEVEAALNEHPTVKEGVVLARPLHADSGTEAQPNQPKQLVGYIVWNAAQDPTATVQTLCDALARKLPAYMVPAAWVVLDEMPLSSNGKLDRKALSRLSYFNKASTVESPRMVPPRTVAETRLSGIWRMVLARDDFGVLDDFFSLGGQSFDAVRCVALIQEEFRLTLSLGDVWIQRTVEKLALRISAGSHTDHDRRLLPIMADKKGRALFFVHPAGGQVMGYRDLAERLCRPSFGFMAVAEDADNDSMATIEMIAARYVSQMVQAQPDGPYTLGGWSSGSCIAFEMALQLENMGREVDQLFLFDSPAPLLHERIAEADMLRGFFEDLDMDLPVAILDFDQFASLSGEAKFSNITNLLNQLADPTLDAALLYPFYRVFKKVVDAVRSYRPMFKLKNAELFVFRARDGVVTEFIGHPDADAGHWGWARLSDRLTHAEIFDGTHHTLLRAKHAGAVAEVMNRAFGLELEEILGAAKSLIQQ